MPAVYITKDRQFANIKVYSSERINEADIIAYVTDNLQFATGKDARWFMTDKVNYLDAVKVYLTNNRQEADIIINRTDLINMAKVSGRK